MEQYAWTFLGTTVAGVLALFGVFVAHRSQKGTPEHRMIDQLQEDVAQLRADAERDRASHKAEINQFRRRMSAMEERDRVYLPHIFLLNRHIELELGPPAPPIPAVLEPYLREAAEESNP